MREQLGENLYEKASREFSIDATVGKQIEIYQTILRPHGAARTEKRRGVLICGAYGKGNAGDDAILKAILAQMRHIDPDMPHLRPLTQPEADAAALPCRLCPCVRPVCVSAHHAADEAVPLRRREPDSGRDEHAEPALLSDEHPAGQALRQQSPDVRLRHRAGAFRVQPPPCGEGHRPLRRCHHAPRRPVRQRSCAAWA